MRVGSIIHPGWFVVCLTLVTATALAGEATAPSGRTRHKMALQMKHCMKTQMSASKTLWYNEAARLCKAQLDQHREDAAPDALVALESAVSD